MARQALPEEKSPQNLCLRRALLSQEGKMGDKRMLAATELTCPSSAVMRLLHPSDGGVLMDRALLFKSFNIIMLFS